MKSESNFAGLLLMIGTSVIIVTILFEYQVGWIGVERPASEVPHFIFEAWPALKAIWGWQLAGFSLQVIAFAVLLKNSANRLRSFFWASLLLLGLLIVIAFGLTLGSYYPALKVYHDQPALFDAIRGAVRQLYSTGLLSLPILGILYLIEIFGSNGIINRRWGLSGFVFVLLGILISFIPGLPGKLIGAVIFFIPLFIGYAYWKTPDS